MRIAPKSPRTHVRPKSREADVPVKLRPSLAVFVRRTDVQRELLLSQLDRQRRNDELKEFKLGTPQTERSRKGFNFDIYRFIDPYCLWPLTFSLISET